MKNIIYFLLFFIGEKTQLLSQSTNTKGLIVYNYILLFDTLNNTVGKETESFLYFDVVKQQSVYVWDRISKLRSQEVVKTANGMMYLKIKNGASDPIGNIVFKDYTNNNIVCRDYVRREGVAIISDSYTIDWKISDETKTIQDVILQKAECDFRGRHYIAWFNPKIPIPDGPWKLRGLPGLIFEAYDEKKHVQFNFTSLTMPTDFTQKIEAPSDGEHIVYDCIKFTAAHYAKLRGYSKETGAKVQQAGGTIQGGSNIITNTIERCY